MLLWLCVVASSSKTLPEGWRTLSNQSQVFEESRGTLVTAFFSLGTSSKHKRTDYLRWMANLLLKDDPMVIFTTSSQVHWIRDFVMRGKRSLERTVVVETTIEQLGSGVNFTKAFWERQFELDPQRTTFHKNKTYMLYWIWLEKATFARNAALANPFQSQFFLWTDIGVYREDDCLTHPDMPRCHETQLNDLRILDDRVLVCALENFQSPQYPDRARVSIAGAQFAGSRAAVLRWYDAFYATMLNMIRQDLFVGEDQVVMTQTCRNYRDLCKLAEAKNRRTDGLGPAVWFGLSFILRNNDNGRVLLPECGYIPDQPDGEPCLPADAFLFLRDHV